MDDNTRFHFSCAADLDSWSYYVEGPEADTMRRAARLLRREGCLRCGAKLPSIREGRDRDGRKYGFTVDPGGESRIGNVSMRETEHVAWGDCPRCGLPGGADHDSDVDRLAEQPAMGDTQGDRLRAAALRVAGRVTA